MKERGRHKAAGMIKRVFVDPEASEDEITRRIISRLKGVEVVNLEAKLDPLSEEGELRQTWALDAAGAYDCGKESLLLTRHQGTWLKPCPGTKGHVCCNLWVVSPEEGCPMDCSYCCLQAYLERSPSIKLYTNTDEMFEAVASRLLREPRRFFRVTTGELADSLALDEVTCRSRELIPFFCRFPNALLELKTKSADIENLLEVRREERARTVISWSLNAEAIVEAEEHGTASLDERIEAAQQVREAGYRVAFHFDPLVYFEGWKDGYRDAVKRLFADIPAEAVSWISIAPLRYPVKMQGMIRRRFPRSEIALGESFAARDGKYRYFQPIRFSMLRFMWQELKAQSAGLPVYMCMESPAAWRSIVGGPPMANPELVEVYSRSGSLSRAACAVRS